MTCISIPSLDRAEDLIEKIGKVAFSEITDEEILAEIRAIMVDEAHRQAELYHCVDCGIVPRAWKNNGMCPECWAITSCSVCGLEVEARSICYGAPTEAESHHDASDKWCTGTGKSVIRGRLKK